MTTYSRFMRQLLIIVCFGFLLLYGPLFNNPAFAEESTATDDTIKRGAVTNLPLPRFVSLKTSEGNVRRGPSLRHRIDWVFKHKGMPIEIVEEYGHWRQVRDRDGVGGWVHYSLLSGARTVIVQTDMVPLYNRADVSSQINANLEASVIARIETCGAVWCRLKADGFRGWLQKQDIWGVRDDELIE